jgi:ArsR family transcriptional regulator
MNQAEPIATADSDAALDATGQLALLCKAASDPLRLSILRVLDRDSYGVLELTALFAMKQSGMSHHLKVLAGADLVVTRREGNSIFYRRSPIAHDDQLASLKEALFEQVDHLPLTVELQTAIATIARQRTENSRQFFSDNADKFREQQDLIASLEHYGEGVAELLDGIALPSHAHAIEIGPGEGAFLQALSQRFDHVTAVDNSAAMLAKAKAFGAAKQLGNIEYVLADTTAARALVQPAAVIVVNMVLHHAPAPSEIFRDLSALLVPGGALLVTDLCHHDQDWARESCGDIWLGFEPDDLSQWAAAAGLISDQEQYLTLRNGFRVQIRHFLKPQ